MSTMLYYLILIHSQSILESSIKEFDSFQDNLFVYNKSSVRIKPSILICYIFILIYILF